MAFGDLAAVSDAIAWLQIDAQTIDVSIVTRLVTAASGFITQWLGRSIVPQDYEELRDGLGPSSPRFVFAQFPVTAVLLVVVDGVTIQPIPPAQPAAPGMAVPTFASSRAGYLFTPTSLTIRGFWIPLKKSCVTLQYTAGFAVVPPELQQACIELVAQKYRERTRVGVASENVAGVGGQTYSIADMPQNMATLLAKYQAVAPVSTFIRALAPTATDPATIVGGL